MNFQGIGQNQFGGGFQRGGFSGMGGNPMMQMMQMMMQLMMQLMQGQMGGGQMGGPMGGMSPGMNPGFGGGGGGMPGFGGGGGGGCGCGGGGGVPGFGGFGGNGNNYGGGNYGGGGGRGVGGNGGGFRSTDGYVPSGGGATGPVGPLGSGQGSDAVRWALGKEGISESNNPGAVRGFSRGAWQPWCADFVSQAYKNSPGGSPFGHQSSVAGILGWGRQNGRFFGAGAAAQNPGMLRPGDIATWKSGGKSHVGLVTGINQNGTFSTIEGNSGDAVRRRTHSFGRGLTGFVRPRGQMPGR
jgi:CHAP domain